MTSALVHLSKKRVGLKENKTGFVWKSATGPLKSDGCIIFIVQVAKISYNIHGLKPPCNWKKLTYSIHTVFPRSHLVVLLRHVVEHVEEGLTTELAHMRLASAATHSNRSSGCLWKKTNWKTARASAKFQRKSKNQMKVMYFLWTHFQWASL